jgi:PBP1b-binding outer membrane lipoprotein LpoB
MKFINRLALLFAALFFAGCASTDDSASAADNAGADTAAPQADDDGGLLMDRYKSGEIPGYRN